MGLNFNRQKSLTIFETLSQIPKLCVIRSMKCIPPSIFSSVVFSLSHTFVRPRPFRGGNENLSTSYSSLYPKPFKNTHKKKNILKKMCRRFSFILSSFFFLLLCLNVAFSAPQLKKTAKKKASMESALNLKVDPFYYWV